MNLVHFLSQSTGSIGILGGLVGGTAAAAKNIKDYRNGDVTETQAAIEVGKETLGAGVATAAGAAAAGLVGTSVVASVLAVITVSTGAKFLWDMGVDKIEESLVEKDDLDAELAETAETAEQA